MTRPRTTAGCRSDAEILTDFAKMLALRALLDDLRSIHATEYSESTTESGSVATDYVPDGEGRPWRRKSSSS